MSKQAWAQRFLVGVMVIAAGSVGLLAAKEFHEVKPKEFDPGKTELIGADWIKGIGCPTDASEFNGTTNRPYTDNACTTGDSKDKKTEGLLLAKTGRTQNVAMATAELKDVDDQPLTELGYDIRKPVELPRGSRCTEGAPQFSVTIGGSTVLIGCRSPLPSTTVTGTGWLRLRWGGGAPLIGVPPAGAACPAAATPVTGGCDITNLIPDSIFILFNEGQNSGDDKFGLAVLDNIDVNGTLVGKK